MNNFCKKCFKQIRKQPPLKLKSAIFTNLQQNKTQNGGTAVPGPLPKCARPPALTKPGPPIATLKTQQLAARGKELKLQTSG